MHPGEGRDEIGYDGGIDAGGDLAARHGAFDHPAGFDAAARRIGGKRFRSAPVRLRLGDDRAEDRAGNGIAPVRQQIGQESDNVALDAAGIGIGELLLPLVDIEQQCGPGGPPAIDGGFAGPGAARDRLDREAGMA